jgi:hypothetical protein
MKKIYYNNERKQWTKNKTGHWHDHFLWVPRLVYCDLVGWCNCCPIENKKKIMWLRTVERYVLEAAYGLPNKVMYRTK